MITNHSPPGVRFPARLRLRERAGTLARSAPDVAVAPDGGLNDTLRRVWALPKVELHLHLEGGLRPETVCDLARRYEAKSPLCRSDWHGDYWTFRDLTGFVLEFGHLLRTCIRTPDDYYRAALECFEDLAAQHVIYAEVSFSPRKFGSPYYVSLEDTLAPIEQARRAVEARMALRLGIILGLSRQHALAYADQPRLAESAQRLLREALRARDAGAAIVGIDLHGDEQAAPDVAPFVPVFRAAAEAGLRLRAHAGEGTGPEGVWASLRDLAAQRIAHGVRDLAAQRIAHGVRAIEDPALVRHLARTRTPLDVCPTSNVLIGLAPTFAAHPVRALHDAGVALTISSDDPVVFGTSITAELALIHHVHGFTFAELGSLTAQAAAASFLPEAERAALEQVVGAAWAHAGEAAPQVEEKT